MSYYAGIHLLENGESKFREVARAIRRNTVRYGNEC